MIKIPTMEDRFSLTRIYPQFQKVSNTALKDYGYMEVFKYLDDHPQAKNILEFGHGFNLELFRRYGETRNVWGADAWQGLHYFPPQAKWAKEMERQISDVPKSCTFRNCLLGAQNETDLPGGFSMSCVRFPCLRKCRSRDFHRLLSTRLASEAIGIGGPAGDPNTDPECELTTMRGVDFHGDNRAERTAKT